MATEIPAVPSNSPATKPSIADRFRAGADPDNKTGLAAKSIAAVETPEKKVETPAQTKEPVKEVVKAEPEKKIEGDPSEGLKAAAKPNDRDTNLANLRKAKEDAERKNVELETRLRETEARIPSDYDQVKKDRETLEQALERHNVEESTRFKEKYTKPSEQLIASIKKTLAVTEADGDSFATLVQMPESKDRTAKLSEAIEGLDRISQGKIATAVSNYDQLRDQRAAELQNPQNAFQEVVKEQQQKTEKQKADNARVMEDTLQEAQKVLPWFKPIEGNDAWNQRLEKIQNQAREFWTKGSTPQNLAAVTLAGTTAPMLMEALEISRQENEKLNEELAQFRESTPKTGAGGAEAKPKGEAKAGGALAAFRAGFPGNGR